MRKMQDYIVQSKEIFIGEEKTNRVKTDTIDARRLAHNLEKNDYKSCCVPDKERREDRQLSRTLEDIQGDIVRTRNRIWKMFDFHGIDPKVDKNKPGKDDIKKLRKLTKKEQYQKTYDIIRRSPGIGWFTAIRLVLEWGEDLSRFASKRKIASFVGLVGSEHSTGETVRRGSLTGLGHKHSRTWLVECTWVAIRKDPILLEKYKRVLRNTGSKKKAVVATARKLVGRILRCVTLGQPYIVGLVATGCAIQ